VKDLFMATIILMTTIAILILCYSVFSEPFYIVNESLREAANTSGNQNLSDDVNSVTGKTEKTWLAWPIVFVVGIIIWYFVWGQKWIYEGF